ncbi:hypothetical protein J3Q64DRAFT_1750971 [Phycomyces blakesleeanus]|uniref:Uncharacterized protein n=1 Tax=Phycomyces blakesleeanus TaxID=4837 RepID=A0ABR3AWL7_PHYBL
MLFRIQESQLELSTSEKNTELLTDAVAKYIISVGNYRCNIMTFKSHYERLASELKDLKRLLRNYTLFDFAIQKKPKNIKRCSSESNIVFTQGARKEPGFMSLGDRIKSKDANGSMTDTLSNQIIDMSNKLSALIDKQSRTVPDYQDDHGVDLEKRKMLSSGPNGIDCNKISEPHPHKTVPAKRPNFEYLINKIYFHISCGRQNILHQEYIGLIPKIKSKSENEYLGVYAKY